MNALNTLSSTPFSQDDAAPRHVSVSLEWVAYVLICVLALILRVAELDTVPLTAPEAQQALSAWRVVVPGVAGAPILPESPLLFTLHSLSFVTLGGSEMTVRIFTALAGVLLVLSPVLFRRLIGRERALLASVVLLASPTLLAASRFDSPVIWTVLSGVLAVWAGWRWWETQQEGYALASAAFLSAALFLGDPTGPLFVLILVLAGGFALWIASADVPSEDSPGFAEQIPARLRAWPWQLSLLVGIGTVLLVSTWFMTRLEGLSGVSELLSAGLRGITTPRPGAPLFYPLFTSLFYEPVIWLFAVVAVVMLARRGAITIIERSLIYSLAWTLIAWLLYSGAGPEQAVWAEVPLAILVGGLIFNLLSSARHPLWDAPVWGKPVLAGAVILLLFIFTVHIQSVARSLLTMPPDTFNFQLVNSVSLVWVLMTILLLIIGVFLSAGIWGMATTLQGVALGVLSFTLLTGLGSGWNIAVPQAANPVELWHTQTTAPQVTLLRGVLIQLAERGAGGVDQELEVSALVPQDGVVAWLLRDFNRTHFITDVGQTGGAGIVILPELAEPPDLGGSYVGDGFTISYSDVAQPITLVDFPAWWLQRQTRTPGVPLERVVLWLRQDVYNGISFDQIGTE